MWALLARAASRLTKQHDTRKALPPFLALPAELRNLIYEFMIAAHETRAQPNFVNACRQTRTEALDLFYSNHRFDFGPAGPRSDHIYWLGAIGESKVEFIRFVRGTIEMYDNSHPNGLRVTPVGLEIEIRDNGGEGKALVARFLDEEVQKRCGEDIRAAIAQDWETLLRTGPSQNDASSTVMFAVQQLSIYTHLMW
ncbi:hypothetical protein LTR17_007503 [Elasticomyces elasticus]|nr:hypothetical protein LTR17_007503 [Elasticomyces elasticus]